MTLQQLKYLVEIAKYGSITEAAKKLFIAQPSLSKAIKDLEEEYQIEILKRSHHGVCFTNEGNQFLRFAQRIIDVSDNMTDFFAEVKKQKEPLCLEISSQHYMFVVDALIDYINRLDTNYKFAFHLSEVRTSQVIKDVVNQVSQIGILYISSLTERYLKRIFEKNRLEFIPFYDFPPYVYLAREHPLASKSSITIEELKEYPYVRYDQRTDPYQFSEEIDMPYVHSDKIIYVTDRSTMLSIIGHTYSYNIGTGCLVQSVVGNNITAIPLSGNYGRMKIGWIKRRDLLMNSAMEEFVQQMELALQRVSSMCH